MSLGPRMRIWPIKSKKSEVLTMFALSKSEVRRILDAIDLTSPFGRRDYLMVLFMYHTGLRVGETSGLVIDLVDHDRYPRQYLHLPAAI